MLKKCTLILSVALLPLSACNTLDDHKLGRGAAGAGVGAAAGAGVAAVAGSSILLGAAVGAAVGGLAGAVWADRDHDGRADGYVRDGKYYSGGPR